MKNEDEEGHEGYPRKKNFFLPPVPDDNINSDKRQQEGDKAIEIQEIKVMPHPRNRDFQTPNQEILYEIS